MMMRTVIGSSVIGLALLAGACAPSARTTGASSGAPVPDRVIGLSQHSVFDTPTPQPVIHDGSEPGSGTPADPAYPGAPPVISHDVSDFVPITRDSNACIDCHMVEEKVAGEPTPIPASHFTDLRNAPDEVGQEVVGARFDCTTCHAVRTEAAPLVKNRFVE